ncbi:MAG: Crp/Fnr family transcriptional regulator [Stagnimonas sp.]|nr:Crp/Fnr family transcriptional regulator [Stagnimonas sp.]
MAFDTLSKDFSAPAIRSACTLCPVGGNCVTGGLPAADMQRWAGVMIPHLPLAQVGKQLYAAGANADCVYVVRAGCIKTYTVDGEGNERVRGFFLPGDVVGLDAIGIGHYPENAVTVVAAQVCRVSKGQLQGLLASAPALNMRVMERLTRDLRLALALGGDYSAEQRVAAFLLHIQERLGGKANVLKLPMSRRDIGSYLRLATETVCRTLTKLEERGWIISADKTVTLREPAALWAVAEPVGICRPRLRLAA